VLWALVILVVPIAGPLLYASIGPTSFLPRPGRSPSATVGDADPLRPRARLGDIRDRAG